MTREEKIWATRRANDKVKPWNKGLTAKTDKRLKKVGESISTKLTGREFTDEWKEKLSAKAKGKKVTDATRKKMSAAHTGLKRPTPVSTRTRRKMSAANRRNRSKGVYKDTSIELKTEAALELAGIKYVKQYDVPGVVVVDFYLPDTNTILECDGCYYHSCPEHHPTRYINKPAKDALRTKLMRDRGYTVLRIWEHDINRMTIRKLSNFISNKL